MINFPDSFCAGLTCGLIIGIISMLALRERWRRYYNKRFDIFDEMRKERNELREKIKNMTVSE